MHRRGTQPERWQLRYWSIFSGQAMSLIGSSLTQFVLLWWITDTTSSVSALAMAGLAAMLPQALLGPLGGTFADRYNRRLILILSDLGSALCMAVLVWLFLTHRIELWHVYVMMAVRSALQAFQYPATVASTPMLVPEHFLTRAAGLNQTMYGVMLVGAAPLGALAIGIMPIGLALSIDVVTALLAIIPLMIYRIPQAKTPTRRRSSIWLEFREGVDTVWQDPALRWMYLLLTAAIVVVMPTFTMIPLLVKAHFAGGAQEVAIIESLSGVGMVTGGLLVALMAPRRRAQFVLWGIAISCFTVAITGLPGADMFWVAVVMWTVSSVAYVMGTAPFTAIVQTTVPNHLQGRVLSLLSTLMGLGAPAGLLLAGPLGQLIGVRWLFFVLGFGGGAITLLGFLSASIRQMDDRTSATATDDERYPESVATAQP
jgi:DHA3 family macrolide efflux protein-like MFS transporter